jgi:hypothetical protein
MEDTIVSLDLGRDEAMVIFELLSHFSVEDGALSLADPVNRLSLVRLHGALEKALVEPFDPRYEALLNAARTRLSECFSG